MAYYVSSARGFDEGVPAHLWTRFTFRADLALHRAIKELAVALIVKHARKCRVELHAVAVLDNHVHVVASQRGKVRWEDRWKFGVSPFTRNWKSALSRHLRLLGLSGSKFEARFGSANLLSWERYITAFAYVVGQAVHHGGRPEDVVISQAVLDGDEDGIADVIPLMFADGCNVRERAQRFGLLIQDVIENARALAAGEEIAAQPGEARVRRRQALERDRDRRRRWQRRRQLSREDWWHAAQVAMWDHGFDGALHLLEWVPAATIRGDDWIAAASGWQRFRLPELTVRHERNSAQRVVRTMVAGGGETVWVEWPLRMDLDPP